MLPHIQLDEKVLFEHQQRLLHEAQQQRLLKQASRRRTGRVRHLFAGVRKRFTMPSTGTRRVERREEFFAESREEPVQAPELQGTGR
jgi:hypothetical protein